LIGRDLLALSVKRRISWGFYWENEAGVDSNDRGNSKANPSEVSIVLRMNLRMRLIVKDLIFITIGTIAVALLVARFHLIDRFAAFYLRFTYAWELEEVIVVSLFLVFALGIFAWRRWKELRLEIVERIRLESELRESQRTLTTLMSNLPGMAYRCRNDKDRTMEFISDGATELTGYLPSDLNLSHQISYGQIIHTEDRTPVRNHIEEALQSHRPFQIIYRINTRIGQEKWVWEQGRGIYASSGEALALEGIVLDITERKRIEEQENLQREQLAQADKMITLGTLVSGVAHEINNPTNFITLNTPILREAWQGTRLFLEDHYQKEGDFPVGRFKYSVLREKLDLLFDGIAEGAERIKNIVMDLKNFARPDPSDLDQPVDVNKVIMNSVSLLRNSINKRTKHFTLELGTDLPLLRGSFQKLEQVMINLIQNAYEALPDNQKTIAVSSMYNPVKDCVLIRIRDQGCGISEELLPRILDPFFTTKRASGGVGLGLSITSRIIEDHDGTLGFDSIFGKGTTVTVTLPVRKEENTIGK
jgi:PAS domain S-box-containing protein